ncbi:hypothetical protein ACIPYQ_16070 [Streptomyces sp. NPDC090045]|uniref:hypothetical protein n=1 Tax=Streptomyces sp. NPDC090045 TaxID=3365927 RepID=UPI0038033449
MSPRPILRSLVIGACTAALMAGSGLLTLTAQAEGRPAASASTAVAPARKATRAELKVIEFWEQYYDAANGWHSKGKDTFAVRKDFLTTELDEALTQWGSDHQTDPVLRSKELPKEATIVTAGAGAGLNAGHEKVVVTQTFENGTTQDVWYQVNLETMIIDGLQDPTA